MQISSRNLQFVVIALLFVILFTIVTKDFSNGSARAVLTSNESTKYQQTNTIVSPNVVPKDDLVSCKNALLNFKNDLNDLPEEIKASLASLVAKQEQESNKNIVSESRAGGSKSTARRTRRLPHGCLSTSLAPLSIPRSSAESRRPGTGE